MNNAITVTDFEKRYKDIVVIQGVNFSVKKGEIFALMGENGAGKTTTLECIEGLREITNGSIAVNGKLGVQLQSSTLQEAMKVKEAVTLFSKWNNSQLEKEILEELELNKLMQKQYSQLSTGQKRRLHLGLALIGSPDIIVLDEPTAGLDVAGRVALHKLIKKLKAAGKTILLASHDMAEIEELCDRIAILKQGKLAFVGTVSELAQQVGEKVYIHLKSDTDFSNKSFANSEFVEQKQEYLVFAAENLSEAFLELLNYAKENNIKISDIKTISPSLEERFLDITKSQGEN